MNLFPNAGTPRRKGRGEICLIVSATSAPLRLCVKIIGILGLAGGLSASKPESPKLPSMREAATPRIAAFQLPGQKKTIFGVGVGFARNGAAEGATISTVLPKSPAARAGLAVGCVITEINGESTVGHEGDDCARMIRDSFGPVRLKYLDPALKEKALTLDKAWLTLPE